MTRAETLMADSVGVEWIRADLWFARHPEYVFASTHTYRQAANRAGRILRARGENPGTSRPLGRRTYPVDVLDAVYAELDLEIRRRLRIAPGETL